MVPISDKNRTRHNAYVKLYISNSVRPFFSTILNSWLLLCDRLFIGAAHDLCNKLRQVTVKYLYSSTTFAATMNILKYNRLSKKIVT